MFLRERDINREISVTSCTRAEADKKFPAQSVPVAVQATQLPCPASLPVSSSVSYASLGRAPSKSAQECPQVQLESTVSSTPSAIDVMAANLSALTAIMSQISEQNRTIIKQNAEVIRLLKIPKLKQSSLTDSISRTPKTPKSTPSTSRTVLSSQEGSQERNQAKLPQSQLNWLALENAFYGMYGVSHVLGAVDI